MLLNEKMVLIGEIEILHTGRAGKLYATWGWVTKVRKEYNAIPEGECCNIRGFPEPWSTYFEDKYDCRIDPA